MTRHRDPVPLLSRRRVLGLGALAAGALLVGCSSDDDTSSPPPGDAGDGWAGTLLDPPFEKPDVTLTNIDGTPFPFQEATAGKLTVLFFGFTSCPDVCPIFLSSISKGREMVDGPGSTPQVLFVGVDTARDTAEVMKTYLGNVDDTFTGLTGAPKDIDAAIAALKMAPVEIGEPDAEGNYDVGHPARVYVFSPDNKAHRLYGHDVTPKQWSRDLPILAAGKWT